MKQNEILKIYGTEYKEITRKLLDQTDLYALIPSADAVIGIKPNLVTPTPKELTHAATTVMELVMAADWIAIGIPSALSFRTVFPSGIKLFGLKSNPKLSL